MENLSCRAWSLVETAAQRANLKVNRFQIGVSGQLFEFVLVLFDPQPDPVGIWIGTEGMHHPFDFTNCEVHLISPERIVPSPDSVKGAQK